MRIIPRLMIALALSALAIVPGLKAQTFTTLHNFYYADGGGSEGSDPIAGLILSSNVLYGTTYSGGSSGFGAVFKIKTDGTGYTNLYSFTDGNDGAFPLGGLILSSNTLYGTTSYGGGSNNGVVFAIHTDGTGFTNLHSFTGGSNGANPVVSLTLSGGTLFGTALNGGSSNSGTIFAISTNGTGFTNLYNFIGGNDGAAPRASLILSGNTLYGTANSGGSAGNGTVFAVLTNGTGFTNLHTFTTTLGSASTNSDGAGPTANLLLSSNTLYGTAYGGGSSGKGTVFAVSTNGTGFTNLYNFSGGSDGAGPQAGLILSTNTLYGTTGLGGYGYGTVFAVNVNGTGFNSLYSFSATILSKNSDGAYPRASLVLSSNILYGAAQYGGSSGDGTVFSVLLGGASSANLVVNGGFEASFSSWFTFGSSGGSAQAGSPAHSGSRAAIFSESFFNSQGSYNGLFENLPTQTGATYLLSFWLNHLANSQCLVIWNGNVVFQQYGYQSGWTNNQITVTATGTNTQLEFYFPYPFGQSGIPCVSGLDDVSVTLLSLPGYNQIAGSLLSDGKMQLSFVGNAGTSYALDRSFNLAPPNWIPQLTNTADASGSLVFTNTPNSATNNFWRIRSVP